MEERNNKVMVRGIKLGGIYQNKNKTQIRYVAALQINDEVQNVYYQDLSVTGIKYIPCDFFAFLDWAEYEIDRDNIPNTYWNEE